ncbi:hypothetical protein DPV79_16010 [Burkholderia reimsis]|uniref:Uncharacterized protein n=1 Tax=Burkholderia reimsis TaxID=2234132 RepID=A0A365QUS5_9BURK|nr:hypothetical protein DPV79_16010 [Burkholderia reimsis]
MHIRAAFLDKNIAASRQCIRNDAVVDALNIDSFEVEQSCRDLATDHQRREQPSPPILRLDFNVSQVKSCVRTTVQHAVCFA